MTTTFTNLIKNAITPKRIGKAFYAIWDDPVITWDSLDAYWDSPLNLFTTNLSKNTITPTNLAKH